MNFEKLNMV